jgi:hypothetical protein
VPSTFRKDTEASPALDTSSPPSSDLVHLVGSLVLPLLSASLASELGELIQDLLPEIRKIDSRDLRCE